jgi:hypothetical protein
MTIRVLDNNDKLKGLIFFLILFNVLDGMMTIAWVGSGRATEANPLMELLIQIHPVLFMATKILLVGLGALLLWRFRDRALAVGSLYLCVAAYLLLMLYHGNGVLA